ncbi:MAG: HAMP domain-containing protein [Anaerolineae bacterium]|nr:MAG: HAMP domain-containing protein [Anaerolineae bacterium]
MLLLIYLAATLAALFALRKGFLSLGRRRLLLFFLLAFATVLLSNTLKLRFSNLWLPSVPGTPEDARPLEIAPLAWLFIGLTAARLGILPATLVALASGLVQTAFEAGLALQVFETVGLGLTAGFLLTQDYAGRLGKVLRQPVVAVPLASLVAWLLRAPSLFVKVPASLFYALNYVASYSLASLSPRFWSAVAVGAGLQFLFWAIPGLVPIREGRVVPPYERSLQQRLFFTLVPSMLLVILLLFYAVTVTAVRVSTEQIVTQVERDAGHAADWIPLFFAEGQSLLDRLASDETLRNPDPAMRQEKLRQDISSPGFFSQLILLTIQGEVTAAYPADTSLDLALGEMQMLGRVRSVASSMAGGVHRSSYGDLVVSFMAPLDRTDVGLGILLGRVSLGDNPTLQSVLNSLQGTMGAGRGFILDQAGQIVAHPDPMKLLQPWHPASDPLVSHTHLTQRSDSRAYEDMSPSNNLQRLVYYSPVEGHPWAVAIEIPYEMILRQAIDISTPPLIRLVVLAFAGSGLLFFAARYLMHPMEHLAGVAGQIAAGHLDTPVETGGEDEVGRLRTAFEQMRRSLKERLDQLSLLWQVSQAVSGSLELENSLSPILEGALEKTGACGARIVLLSVNGAVEHAISRGPRAGLLAALDSRAATMVLPGQRLLINNLAREREPHFLALRQAGLRALCGLPLTARGSLSGVFWLAFDAPRPFEATEVGFLSTLAGQAAVAAQSARLFASARNGRQRLEAILASASDVIIVTDSAGNLLLANPAAEQAFRALVDSRGRPVEVLLMDGPEVARQLFTAPLEDRDGVLTEELMLPDGRVLYASVCAVNQQRGQMAGRVAVLRDITYLKELDRMKSDFVNTVSHDLRSPLTSMRGYATMIPMVDKVTPKQQEFVDKIVGGIEHMTQLIDDLLDIGRIEAGVDIEMSPCRVDELTRRVVQELRPRAIANGLELAMRLPEAAVSPVWGDRVLLGQAITNLVDNAIKYTFEGSVSVGLAEKGSRVVVWVKDTGIGIEAVHLPRLFEKFHRINRRDTIKIKGTGLGLAIVKSIADLHKGRVWVESEPDRGSTFYLALPKHVPE